MRRVCVSTLPGAPVAARRRAMPVTSAGVLLYRGAPDLEVFIAHMGGPFWAAKHEGAWTIPKGEYAADSEDPLAAARREFAEEIGTPAPDIELLDLGGFR